LEMEGKGFSQIQISVFLIYEQRCFLDMIRKSTRRVRAGLKVGDAEGDGPLRGETSEPDIGLAFLMAERVRELDINVFSH
jgi:hypothetical protein